MKKVKELKKVESEADFGEHIVQILRDLGFETWQEVYLGKTGLGNPCIDIVAKLGKIYIAFELKLHLNDDVLAQAQRNRSYVDYTIALVAYNNGRGCNLSAVKAHYIKSFGIGVYAVNWSVFVSCLEKLKARGVKAEDILRELIGSKRRGYPWFHINGCICYGLPKRVTRRRKKKRKGKLLIETYLFPEQKECTAGVQGGERSTPFKRSCTLIEGYLKEHPESSKKEIWEALGKQLHWRSYNSMCGSFRTWHDKLDCMKSIVFGEAKAKDKNKGNKKIN